MTRNLFDWRIDPKFYLANKSQHADKMKTKDFIKYVVTSLNMYRQYTFEDLRNHNVTHCHSCDNLDTLPSTEAHRLKKHIEDINVELADLGAAVEPKDVLQLDIKNVPSKSEYRCYGIVMDGYFYLVYLAPDHEIYKE